MSETLTTKALAARFHISDRQCRNYLAAIRDRHPELSAYRGNWPAWVAGEFEAIRALGLAAYARGAGQGESGSAIARTEIAPIVPTAIAPAPKIARTEITPYTGEGLMAAASALDAIRARLAAAEMEMDEQAAALDAHAIARDAAVAEILDAAARLKAKQAAIRERQILEQERDQQLGKFAASA